MSPLERLHRVRDRDLQVFFRWRLQIKKVRKVSTLLNDVKHWSMMYRDDMGRAANKDMIQGLNTVRRVFTLYYYFHLQSPVLSYYVDERFRVGPNAYS